MAVSAVTRLLQTSTERERAQERMSLSLAEARERMLSKNGFMAIDCDNEPAPVHKKGAAAIATELTGELTPSGSACEGEEDEQGGELTRTLSALQRLSVQEQTTLRRKLGAQQQSSRCLEDSHNGSLGRDSGKPESSDVVEAAADSPFRVVLQKAVVESNLASATAALASGADPNERDDLCHSSLHFAAAKGEIRCLRELMRSGARANVANNVSVDVRLALRLCTDRRSYCSCCLGVFEKTVWYSTTSAGCYSFFMCGARKRP